MGKIIKLGFVLLVITAVTGLILGAVHTITLEPIRIAEAREKNEALAATLPGATEFKEMPLPEDHGIVTEIYEGSDGSNTVGYNFTVTPKGYGGLITIIVGIASDGRVMDIKILGHNETPGLGAKAVELPFSGQFTKKAVDKFVVTKLPPVETAEIQAISGATITSTAVVDGVNTAINCWKENFAGKTAEDQEEAE